MPVIGYLSTGTPEFDADPYLVAFRKGFEETGYIVGRNVAIEYRWAEFQNDRLPARRRSDRVDALVLLWSAWTKAIHWEFAIHFIGFF